MSLWQKFKSGCDFVFYFRPKQWVSWDFVKSTTGKTIEFIQETYTIKKAERNETFAQALYRHALTPEDLQKIKQRYWLFSMVFLTMTLAMLLYAGFSLYQSFFLQTLSALSLSFYIGSLSFRYHFWYFQIDKQKLGLSFQDWWKFVQDRKLS